MWGAIQCTIRIKSLSTNPVVFLDWARLYSNRAACHLRLGNLMKCSEDSDKVKHLHFHCNHFVITTSVVPKWSLLLISRRYQSSQPLIIYNQLVHLSMAVSLTEERPTSKLFKDGKNAALLSLYIVINCILKKTVNFASSLLWWTKTPSSTGIPQFQLPHQESYTPPQLLEIDCCSLCTM